MLSGPTDGNSTIHNITFKIDLNIAGSYILWFEGGWDGITTLKSPCNVPPLPLLS